MTSQAPASTYTVPVKSELRHRKSDIFNVHAPNYSGLNESPISAKKVSWDRNASNVFNYDALPAPSASTRRASYHSQSDIFNQGYAQQSIAPSAEPMVNAREQQSAYTPSSASAPKRQLSATTYAQDPEQAYEYRPQADSYAPETTEYQDHQFMESQFYKDAPPAPLSALSQFEQLHVADRAPKVSAHHQHSDIFSDPAEESFAKGGRRHYDQSRGYSDIFNLSSTSLGAEAPQKRSSHSLPAPEWTAGSSFSNVFGGSSGNLNNQQEASPARYRRSSRAEPSMMNRPSGLSSTDLNRERVAARGRPTFDKAQDQFKSQIWF